MMCDRNILLCSPHIMWLDCDTSFLSIAPVFASGLGYGIWRWDPMSYPLCLCVAAGEWPARILLLYLPRIPGSEGGISRHAGGDHQWPAAKGGIRERQAPLLSQEVMEDAGQEELCLKFPHVVLHLRRTQEITFLTCDGWLTVGRQFLKLNITSRVWSRESHETRIWQGLNWLKNSSLSTPSA